MSRAFPIFLLALLCLCAATAPAHAQAPAESDLARARAHMAAPATGQQIADIHILAETLRLQGTPTFLVNGRTTNGIAPAEVARAIAEAKRAAE